MVTAISGLPRQAASTVGWALKGWTSASSRSGVAIGPTRGERSADRGGGGLGDQGSGAKWKRS